MVESFKRKEIPRIEGNQLSALIANFDEIVHSIYSPNEDGDRKRTFEALAELYRTAEAATDEDIQHLAIGYFGDNTSSIRVSSGRVKTSSGVRIA